MEYVVYAIASFFCAMIFLIFGSYIINAELPTLVLAVALGWIVMCFIVVSYHIIKAARDNK